MIPIVAIFSILLVQSSRGPIRVGELGPQLSDGDMLAIERLLPSGVKPWLISAGRIHPGPEQYVTAYLPATTTTVGLRRGPIVTMTRSTIPAVGPWTVSPSSGEYTQVALAGR